MISDFATKYREVVDLLIEGRGEQAKACLAHIPGRPESFKRRGRGLPRYLQLASLRRDGFVCRHCGRKACFRLSCGSFRFFVPMSSPTTRMAA